MLEIIDHGAVRELRLARPPANALDPALISSLRAGLAGARAAGREAVVLSGAPGRFSGGLDVPALLPLPRAEIRETWKTFFGVMRDIAASPIPTVAALTGHSPAGGTVLALFADYRVMADGPYVMGLNEVQVGLPVPTPLLRALTYVVGARQAERLAVGGILMSPADALRCGLVDEVVALDAVVPRAVAWASELLSRPRAAMTATRRQARRAIASVFDDLDERYVETVVDVWFSAETQTAMRALVARLKKS
ncbi:MAG TPA: enoyl-CoA hydratase/isomerase family protein [Polyangia bacterium]|nr:enoyl-CoA hydratase/isomerase family protein [Polyangia bacterium]